MTNKQARRKCVNHWKRMLKLTVEDIKAWREVPDGDNCAFCELYLELGCEGCPISQKTGEVRCGNTPYKGAHTWYISINQGQSTNLKSFYKAVQKEIDFLEALEL